MKWQPFRRLLLQPNFDLSSSKSPSSLNSKSTRVDLLRHGELQTSGLFCANETEQLSDKGFQQLSKATKNKQWDLIVSSPYQRCQKYAERLAQKQPHKLIILDSFKEMDFGRWTNQPQITIWEHNSTLLKQLWDTPENFIAPDGEAMIAFIKRVNQGWLELIKQYQGQSILVLTHAGVIRCILANTLNIPYKSTLAFNIGYAKYTRLHCYPDQVYSLVEHGV